MLAMIKKDKIDYLILLLFSFISRLFNSLASPLFHDFCFQGDNAIFYCMGREILRGKVLYADMVDNKPPYTFFVNTLASIIETNHIGSYILEVIIIFVSLLFVYKIIKLYFDNNVVAVISALLFSLLLNNTYITLGMSKTECYVIPFTLITIYYILIYFKFDGKIVDKKFAFILGLCAGAAFMFNQKSAFFFISIATVLLIKFIVNKELKKILVFIPFGLIGLIIVIVPYIVYMLATGSASYAYTCIFEMALNYISNDASIYYEHTGILGLMCNYIMEYKIFFLFILVSLLIVIIKEKNIYIKLTYILSLILTIYAISAANNRYMYYLASLYIFFLPILIFIASILCRLCQVAKLKSNVIIIGISIMLVLLINIPIGYSINKAQYFAKHNFNESMRSVLLKYYDKLDDLKVLAPGFNPEVYMAINLNIDFPCFFTMNNTYEVAPVFYNQQLKYIEKRQPDVIVIRPTSSYSTFPEIMQEKIMDVLDKDYKRVEDVDSKSNYGIYNIYIKKA